MRQSGTHIAAARLAERLRRIVDRRRFDELTWISARAAVEHIPGVTAERIDGAIDAARDPTFEYGEMTMVRAVGYRA